MTRIAAALLIVGAALAFSGWTNPALADDHGSRLKLEAKADTCSTESRANRVMSLMLCLEALTQAPAATPPKAKA